MGHRGSDEKSSALRYLRAVFPSSPCDLGYLGNVVSLRPQPAHVTDLRHVQCNPLYVPRRKSSDSLTMEATMSWLTGMSHLRESGKFSRASVGNSDLCHRGVLICVRHTRTTPETSRSPTAPRSDHPPVDHLRVDDTFPKQIFHQAGISSSFDPPPAATFREHPEALALDCPASLPCHSSQSAKVIWLRICSSKPSPISAAISLRHSQY